MSGHSRVTTWAAALWLAGPAAAQVPAAAGRPALRDAGRVYFCAMTSRGARVSGTVRADLLGELFAQEAPAAGDSPVPVFDGETGSAARTKVRRLLREMLAQSPDALPNSLRGKAVFVVLIPQDKNLTDLPQFRSLRGVKLPDGRVWDDVRGVGFVSQDDGTVAVGVAEENLIMEARRKDGYPKGYLLAHEFSHAVHAYGLDEEASAAVSARYTRRKGAGLPFPSRYASSNAYEYFAVSASVFFERRMGGADPEKDAAWLKLNDEAGFLGLEAAYGSSRPLWTP